MEISVRQILKKAGLEGDSDVVGHVNFHLVGRVFFLALILITFRWRVVLMACRWGRRGRWLINQCTSLCLSFHLELKFCIIVSRQSLPFKPCRSWYNVNHSRKVPIFMSLSWGCNVVVLIKSSLKFMFYFNQSWLDFHSHILWSSF